MDSKTGPSSSCLRRDDQSAGLVRAAGHKLLHVAGFRFMVGAGSSCAHGCFRFKSNLGFEASGFCVWGFPVHVRSFRIYIDLYGSSCIHVHMTENVHAYLLAQCDSHKHMCRYLFVFMVLSFGFRDGFGVFLGSFTSTSIGTVLVVLTSQDSSKVVGRSP